MISQEQFAARVAALELQGFSQPLAEAGPGLDETRRATVGETEAALRSYAQAFPGANLDWLHPSLVGTAQLLELIRDHIAKGVPITVATVEARFGQFAWEW